MSADETRLRIDRARRAELALEEFVAPAIANMRAAYFARLNEIIAREPWEAAKIAALVGAIRTVDTIEGALSLQVKDGDAAKHDLIKIENINSMPAARRKALGI
jgi:hypothetical protein